LRLLILPAAVISMPDRYSGIDWRGTSADIAVKGEAGDSEKLLIAALPVAKSVGEDS
jgi:hypothetical protein